MRYLSILIGILLIVACARQGSPSGGPKDEDPPKYLSSTPDTLSLNVSTNLSEIRIDFDEYLILKDHTQNIVVSPPLGSSPVFTPVGTPNKHIKIKLNEPLQENTTYNINFGEAIQDHNEGNKLSYFQYVFSTGDYIDSLEVGGKVNVPYMRNQPKNLMVGLYKVDSTYNDSIILNQKPFYVAKPDESGKFNLNYLSSGQYQLIAFDDEVQNMQYDFGREKFGFADEIIDLDENLDQDFNLKLFNQRKNYKVGKAEQKGYGHLLFRLEGEVDEVEIEALDFNFTTAHIDYKSKSDSLNFWFNPAIDSIQENSKRIQFAVKHKENIDTISLVYSNKEAYKLKLDSKGKLDYAPGRKVDFVSNYPITHLDSSQVKVIKDSIELNVKLIPNSENKSAFSLDFPIELSSSYEVKMYPNMVTDIFGKTNDSIAFNFKTKSKNEFGNLHLKLEPQLEKPFWIQLLNTKDEILDEQYTQASEFSYNYLPPGEYYFIILVDENENGHWDSGDFFTKTQAEKSYIYPTMTSVRALWDIEETWVIPIDPTDEDLIEESESDEEEKEKSPSESEEDFN